MRTCAAQHSLLWLVSSSDLLLVVSISIHKAATAAFKQACKQYISDRQLQVQSPATLNPARRHHQLLPAVQLMLSAAPALTQPGDDATAAGLQVAC